MIDFNEIHKKPYHFTLERVDPYDENVPEAIIPADTRPMAVMFLSRNWRTLHRILMMRTGGPCLIISTVAHPST